MEKAKIGKFGAYLECQRQKTKLKKWRIAFYVLLGLLLIINVKLLPKSAHFVFDNKPWFWAIFSLVVGILLIFVAKKILQPLIGRKEDYYGDL